MDVITYVDPLLSQISPRAFKSLISAPFTSLFDDLRTEGVPGALFVCGDATKNIEVLCHTGPDLLCVDENVDLVAAKAITDHHGITIGGNIPLTTVMLLGSQQDNVKWVIDALDAVDTQHLILAPGCDMPYDTPVENVVGVVEALRDPDRYRQVIAHYEAPVQNYDVDLPDYATLTRPLMEVFTLDSDSCAACSYMLSAAQRATAEMQGRVDMVEYKITVPENVARMRKMSVSNLPCILINGQLAFSSIIPAQRELLALLEQAVAKQGTA
ncbi:MAG: hypothetical protein GXY79_12145 [Chloroflexi bacterium]|nr:hypothetical protein [Chloroflexota bacterium]